MCRLWVSDRQLLFLLPGSRPVVTGGVGARPYDASVQRLREYAPQVSLLPWTRLVCSAYTPLGTVLDGPIGLLGWLSVVPFILTSPALLQDAEYQRRGEETAEDKADQLMVDPAVVIVLHNTSFRCDVHINGTHEKIEVLRWQFLLIHGMLRTAYAAPRLDVARWCGRRCA